MKENIMHQAWCFENMYRQKTIMFDCIILLLSY